MVNQEDIGCIQKKNPQGSPRRWGRSHNLRVGRCVPVRKTKKKKNWDAILAGHFGRRIGIGSTSALAIAVGLRLGLGVGDAVHRWGHGDAGMGGG